MPPESAAWCRRWRARLSPIGADGMIVEVHPHPEKAISDGAQSLDPKQWRR